MLLVPSEDKKNEKASDLRAVDVVQKLPTILAI